MAIKLGLPKKPRWLDLPQGVRVHVRPLTTAIYETALASSRQQVRRLLDAAEDVEDAGAEIDGLPDLTTEAGRAGYGNYLFAQAMARGAIIAWEGVLDEDGTLAAVSPLAVDELMSWHGIAESFIQQYTRPFQDRIVEGNASGPLPSGTSEEGPKPAGLVN